MLTKYSNINNSLSDDLIEQAKKIYESHVISNTNHYEQLIHMLHQMKIKIPDSMLVEINRCIKIYPEKKFSFNDLTHFVARSNLEEQIQEQIRNVFSIIDKDATGKIDAEDIVQFLKDLEDGDMMRKSDVDSMIQQLDYLNVGYLTYQDLVFLLQPK